MQALIDFGSKLNAIRLAYILKLDFKVCHINIRTLKIDNSIFKTFEIVLTNF